MDLPRVQAAVRAVNPYYVGMVTWKQEGDIIKAFPKYPISEAAFNAIKKVFKRFGGKYVSRYGKCWFELVVENNSVRQHTVYNSPNARQNDSPATAPNSVLTHLQTQISNLAAAGYELTKEA
jgi:hypothetical protein